MNTPWGKSQGRADKLAPGINFYSTAGHGGYKVSKTTLALMPPALRNEDGWYEEDMEWCKIAIAFPHLFTPAIVSIARELHYFYYNPDGTHIH